MSRTIKFISIAYLFFIFLVLIVTIIGLKVFPSFTPGSDIFQKPGESTEYWSRWANWDGGHFRGIAESGYKETQTVFFPLYPLMISVLMITGLNSLYSGIIISLISTFFGLFFFYKLLRLDFTGEFSRKSIFYFLIYPTSFILLAVYSEGLFFALSTASFYFARIKKWQLAYLLAGLSAITRLIGIALIIALFAENFVKNGNQSVKSLFHSFNIKSLSLFLVSFIPLLFYLLYLSYIKNNFLSFIEEELYWGREPTFFWQTIVNSAQSVTTSRYMIGNILELISLFNLIFVVILFTLFFFSITKIRKSYRVYFILSLIIPLSTGEITGIIRYSLVIFPLFITLNLIKNRYLSFGWIIFSISLLLLYSILFINGFRID